MKKLMVYSHDTFGYGNIQRLLAICERLMHSDPNLSILVVSGSPMMQYFRIPKGLDYIKLPAFHHTIADSDLIGQEVKQEVKKEAGISQLRSDLILSAMTHFKPDVFLVDKRPYGVENELEDVLSSMNVRFPETKQILLLGDILDAPETTAELWKMGRFHRALRVFYDLVLLTGSPEMYGASREYQFPSAVSKKVRFCLDLCAFAQITQSIASILYNDPGISAANIDHGLVGHVSVNGDHRRSAAPANA